MDERDVTPDLLQQEETRYLLKSPGFVAMLSAFVMGLGQVFNGQVKKAFVFFFAQVGIFLYLWDFLGHRVVADTLITFTGPILYHAFLTILALAGFCLWAFNIHDAYQTAHFLAFIFDRSMPILDDEEQEFVKESLNIGVGVPVHRGMSRKALFVGTGMALYSIGLVVLGARFSTSAGERAIVTAARENPKDARARLAHGEWLLTRGELEVGRQELEEARRLSLEVRDAGTAYRAFTSLARVYQQIGLADDANKMLREALALYAPQSQETSALPEESADASASTTATAVAPVDLASARPTPAPSADSTGGAGPEAATVAALAKAASPAPADAVRVRDGVRDGTEMPGPSAATEEAARAKVAAREDEPATAHAEEAAETLDEPANAARPALPAAAPAIPQGDPAQLLSRALSNFKVKNYGEANRLLAAYARRGGEETPESLALQGRLHAAVGEWAAAVEPLEHAVAGRPKDAELRKLFADALVRAGRTEPAVENLRTYLSQRPHDPEAVLMLSGLLRKSSRTTEARRLVEEALIEHPEHPGLLSSDFGLALAGNSDEGAYQVGIKLLKAPERDSELARTLVMQALDAQRLALAHRLATAAIQAAKDEPLGYILKGAVLVRQNEPKRAMQFFEKASSLGSQEPELFFEIGALYKKLGRTDRAVESLKRAVDLNPNSVTYRRELGGLYLSAGQFDAARAAFQFALRGTPGDATARLGLGTAYLKLGRTAEARDAFAKVLRAEPGNEDAKAGLAAAQSDERQELLAANPRTGAATAGAVAVQNDDDDEDEGRPAPAAQRTPPVRIADAPPPSTTRIADAPGAPITPAALAARAAGTEPLPATFRPAAAPQPGERPADRDEPPPRAAPAGEALPASASNGPDARDEELPGELQSVMRKADQAYREGDIATAEKGYRAVLAKRSASVRAHYQLGMIHKQRSDGAKAIVELETARRLSPQDADVLLELGQVYSSANLTQRAVQRLEELVKVDPRSLAGRYTLGVSYEKLKNQAGAEQQYRAITQQYPQFSQAHDYLGNLYFSQKRYDQAAREYGQLVEARPRDTKARYKRAVALMYQNQHEDARQEFQTLARALPPGDPLAPKVQSYLAKL